MITTNNKFNIKLIILDLFDKLSILYVSQKMINAKITIPNNSNNDFLNKFILFESIVLFCVFKNKLLPNKIIQEIHIINNNIITDDDLTLLPKKLSLFTDINIVTTTKNIKNNIEPYVPNVEKLFNKFVCCLFSSPGKVIKIIMYKKAKMLIIIVSSSE